MESEQVSQILSISKGGRPLQQLPSVDKDEVNAPPPQKGLNLRPILRTVQRKALLIIGITGVATAVAWHWNSTVPSEYKGKFRLLVEPITNEAKAVQPGALTRPDGQAAVPEISSLDYSTQLTILQRPEMISEILKLVRVRYPDFPKVALEKGLEVKRLISEDPRQPEPTKIIEVGFQSEDPKLIQYVLEVTKNKYLKYYSDERKTRLGEGVRFIDGQINQYNSRVRDLQLRIQTLQQQYKLNDPRAQGDQLFAQVREIANQQSGVQRDLQEQRTLYVNLRKQLDLTPEEGIAASALSEDPNYRALQAKIQEVQNQLAVESARFSDQSPTIQALKEKLDNLGALQSQETQRILGQNSVSSTNNRQVRTFQNSVRIGLIQKMVEVNNQIQQLEVRNQAIARTRDDFEKRAQQFPEIARQYSDLQGQLDLANRTLSQLLTQRETLKVDAAQKQIPWEVVYEPQLDRDAGGNPKPVAGPTNKRVMMGLVGGLVLGVLLALLLEKFRNIFYTSEEIEEVSQLPLLGVIPLYKSSEKLLSSTASAGGSDEIEPSNKSASRFLEAFDSLYANIRFLFADPPIRSLTVCSAAPGDGKSTVALHLAQTAATMGQRVLLVDANFRQPQLHSRLNLPNQKGLSDLLATKLAPNDLIQRSPLADNLFVLTSGQLLPKSNKLLASAQMQYLMEEFQATFDLVIYDTSPLSGFMDANFLAAHTDGILLVVGVSKTRRSVVKKVLNQLNTFRLPTLGVVANHVRKDTSIPYGTLTSTGAKVDDGEIQVHHPAGKWIDFQEDRVPDKKSF
jgi:capsular exopolysaccharide synthesis family protein